MEERMVRFCELCGDEADLYCDADSAFLCRSCDSKFHASNFLFARHFRRIICPDCKSLTGHVVSGPLSPPPPKTTCCSRARGMTEKRRVKAAASGIFVNWCDKLGLNGDSRNAVVSLASLALAVGKPRCSAKVVLAAAFWVGLRNSLNSMTCPSLNNVEDVTGVAPGIFRPLETKLARAVTLRLRRWRLDSEEGWAENDVV